MVSQSFRKIQAFSLVQLSAIVLAAGIVAAAVIPDGEGQATSGRYLTTVKRMENIEQATMQFMAKEARRPCPASGLHYPGFADFGKEDGTKGNCADAADATGILAPFNDANVVAGTVPVNTLGLNPDHYFDGWGRPFTYVVDKRATDENTCVQLTTDGDIRIDNAAGTRIDSTLYTIISHGPDGHGAFAPGGGASTARLDFGSTDADQLKNIGGSMAPGTFTNRFVKRETGADYDDVTWYSEKTKNTCCVGPICAGAIATACEMGDGSIISNATYGVFDGVDDVVIDADFVQEAYTSGSLAVWFKAEVSQTTNTRIIELGRAVDRVGIYMQGGKLYGNARDNASETFLFPSNIAHNDLQWHHVALTWQSGGTANLYVDGVKQTSEDSSFTISTIIGDRLSLGNYVNGGSFYFNGAITDARVYNDALTQDEVTYLATLGVSGTDPTEDNLQALYKFDEGTGTTIGDSKNSNDATATGIDEATFWPATQPWGEFDGSDDFVQSENSSDYILGNTMSVCTQAKFNSLPDGTHQIVGTSTDTSRPDKGFMLSQVENNLAVFYGSFAAVSMVNSVFVTDQWQTICMVNNAGTIQAYVDGRAVGGTLASHGPITTEVGIGVGGWFWDSIDGGIRDTRIYRDALSANEVAYLSTNGFIGTNPGASDLILHYKFDDGSGVYIADTGSACHIGTANNINEVTFWQP